MKQIKDLKVGSIFQMKGLNMDGKIVHVDCTLRAYNGMNKYVVESDGISLLLDGEGTVTKTYS